MPSNERYQIIGYEITGEPELADHNQHYSPEIEEMLRRTYPKALKARRKFLPELLKLIEKYPQVPALKNYLATYYQRLNQPEKAYKVNRQLVDEHPQYLHGRVNLAAEYLFKKQYEKVPEILGEVLDIKALYPHREVFHVNEFEVFTNVACRYLIAMNRLKEAEDRIGLLEEMDVKPELISQLRMAVTAKRLEEMTTHFTEKEARRKAHPIGRSYDRSIQTDEPPKLKHPELRALYENDLRIQPDILKDLLDLPRETLVEDLKLVLWDSVRRYEYFEREIEKKGFDEDQHSFPLHALFLLTELRAVETLPLLLDCLRQGEDYMELWYGDHRFETWWHFLYHLGGQEMEALKAFMLESDIHYSAKNVVAEAVKQIGLHQTERRDQVLEWYETILRYFLDLRHEALLIDVEVISYMVGDLYNLRGQNLLPLVREFYDLKLVDTFQVGNYDDLERDIKADKSDKYLTPLFENVFDHYQHILTTWHGYMNEEQRAARDAMWEKGLKKLEAERGWGSTPQFTPANTIKRDSPKVGRNDPCPCGSGKKYKKCCWRK